LLHSLSIVHSHLKHIQYSHLSNAHPLILCYQVRNNDFSIHKLSVGVGILLTSLI
jgi:hypothetical protein